jgi:AraC family transcriptional regulator of arabinose operon
MAVASKNISVVNTPRFSPHVVFGDVWYEPGGECGPRLQHDYQLVIVLFGLANVAFNTQKCAIPPGSVALMLPGRREHFRFSREHRTHHTWCAVVPKAIPPSLRKRLANLPAVLPQSQAFELLMKAAFSIHNWRQKPAQDMISSLGLALLHEYLRMASLGSGETAREGPCDHARQYLDEHCVEEDCLAGASRAAGITPQHLIRLFRGQYRITPGRYLWQARVERGVALLTATGLTVAQVADRCGFKNPFHFSRLLRKMQGVSPRQLRRRAWVETRKKPAKRKLKPRVAA